MFHLLTGNWKINSWKNYLAEIDIKLMKWYHWLPVFSLPFSFYCVIKLSQSNHRYCWFLLLLLEAHSTSMPIFANATQFLVLYLLPKMLRCWMNYMPHERIFQDTLCNNTRFNFYYVSCKINEKFTNKMMLKCMVCKILNSTKRSNDVEYF